MREFLVVGLVSAVIDVEIDTGHKLNEIGMKHPFVCANFDWWPNEKCDYGQVLQFCRFNSVYNFVDSNFRTNFDKAFIEIVAGWTMVSIR